MLSRVAAVKAPRTHNRRRVTRSSGRRREGRESELQRPNMSRRMFTSAALLLLVVIMCCGTGGAAPAGKGSKSDSGSSLDKHIVWRDKKEDETVDSLYAPSFVEVNGGVFAFAEALLKDGNYFFTGIASELLELSGENQKKMGGSNLKTKTLEKCPSEGGKRPSQSTNRVGSQSFHRVDVSRPTTVVKGNGIYMLAGKYIRENVAVCQGRADAASWGLLLVKGNVSDEQDKEIVWEVIDDLPCTSIVKLHESWPLLTGGGGSGITMDDDTLVLPLEAVKEHGTESEAKEGKNNNVSLILYSSDTKNWKLSKGMSAYGCTDPSVVEWKGKLMMMTACDDGRRRVYESGDKGASWTEALGTLSRVWGNNQKRHEWGVRSGFITANIDGVGNDKRNVMLVTLPVFSKKADTRGRGKERGELHLWLTDNTHIVDIGPVSGNDDAAASSLLYKSGTNGNNNNELIALYEKKEDGFRQSLGMVSVRLTEQLKRVKDVLATWKEVDDLVSKLCTPSNTEKDRPNSTPCSTTVKITAGLVGFLSGNLSGSKWKDEYLGVNARVTGAVKKAEPSDGVTFKGRGAGAHWPVGRQGENQLYHFANYNFTLVATVSIHGVPKDGDTPIPLMGAKVNDGDKNTVLLGLSYNKERKWQALCCDGTTAEHSSTWDPQRQYQVAIVLQNEKQGSVYVDGQRVCESVQSNLENTESKGISHFYIGGDGGSAENTVGDEGVSVTVRNVLLYNRPLTFTGGSADLEEDIASPSEDPVEQAASQQSRKKREAQQVPAALSSNAVGEATGDGSIVRESGLLLLLLLLGLWGFAAL
ncbi:putative trans-sialidase, Group V [Trypanosoma cruzi]|uniref:Trans-sialidase, putative n=2 Tax=Trypanosoma cruzi TaxID=5693 RepID=Q4CQY9_TRYCC|nr:trans-sialidase, putative [Trypanosoma cruzi]EAN82691.1 trans-sialidase, putative [Trypanosoma cruzi]PWV05346.1 putative trans-sialidase, Group V [Trypanosoma cruzi]RNC35345.1 c71 surface protein [Trypanosoma cruzi]|eukprot:XP_804542.1 trans-sialidase [Trypanosoma cruzi strain CL Brener]